MSAVSVWFKAEVYLARARLALKVDDDQLKLEARMRRVMLRTISPIVTAILEGMKAQGYLPLMPIATTQPLLDARSALSAAILPAMTDAALMELRSQEGNPTLSIDDVSPTVQQALRDKAFEASDRTLSKLHGDINAVLNDAYSSGLGIADAAQKIESIFDGLKTYELERIARTEINAAQNVASFRTIQALAIDYHQWIATLDDRVRESHEQMHQQIVVVGKPFSNGLLYPGDSSGPPEEFINCRCRLRPYIMPAGMTAPAGAAYFYPGDVVPRV